MSPAGKAASVSGVVLAAGASSRLRGGVPKQLLELGGETLLRRVVKAALASRLSEVVVVLGPSRRAVGEPLAGLAARTVENPDSCRGQSTSVRAGLAAIAPEAGAALFVPADQPLLSTDLVDRLVAAWEATGGPIVVPVCGGRRGAPSLFDRSLFFELKQLEGDTGGRGVLPRYRSSIVEVPVDDPLELADVDTEADLLRLAEALAARSA